MGPALVPLAWNQYSTVVPLGWPGMLPLKLAWSPGGGWGVGSSPTPASGGFTGGAGGPTGGAGGTTGGAGGTTGGGGGPARWRATSL
jgi:hypothetical protein